MNDGSITFVTALDNSQLEKELSKANKKVLDIEKKLAFSQAKKSPLAEQSKKLLVQLDKASAKLNGMKTAANSAFSSEEISRQQETVSSLETRWNNVQKQVEAYDNAINKCSEDLRVQQEYAGAVEREISGGQPSQATDGATAIEQMDTRISALLSRVNSGASRAVSAVGNGLKTIASGVLGAVKHLNVFSKLSDSLGGKFKRLGNTIKSALVFSVIYKGLGMVKEQIGTYLTLNSDFTAALAKIKGALLTAFQPIYDAVVPALTALLNVLSRVISAVSQFTAALFGTTATQAQSNASALYDQAKATQAAGGAAKDAEKSLAGFDEINKLPGGSKGGGGASATPESVPAFGMELEDASFSSWGTAFSSFLDNLLNNEIPKLEHGLSAFSDRVNLFSANLLEVFTFPGVLSKVEQFGADLATAFNNMVKTINWNQLGQAIGAGLNTAVAFAVSFIYTFDWQSLGSSLAALFNGLISQVDWYHVGMLLFAGFKIGIETLAGFIIGMDMAKLALAAGNLVMGFLDSVTETLQSVDWEEIGHQIKEFLINVDWAGVAKSTFTAIGAAYGALTSFLWGLIKDAWKAVVDWWHETAYEDGKFTLEGLLDGIVSVIKSIGTWIKDNIFQPFIDGFKNVFGINSPSTVMAEMGRYLMDGLLGGINENSGSVLGSFKTILGGVLDFINGAFSGDWSLAWDGIKGVFKGTWNGIVALLEGAVNIIIRGLNWLISQMNKISFDVPDWVPGIGGKTLGVNIPPINEVEIPRLATGAVIPPNREFMAVLGDQKSGTNVEAPLETIVQAVMLALAKGGGGGGQVIENVVNLDGEVIYRNQKRIAQNHGTSLVGGSL